MHEVFVWPALVYVGCVTFYREASCLFGLFGRIMIGKVSLLLSGVLSNVEILSNASVIAESGLTRQKWTYMPKVV